MTIEIVQIATPAVSLFGIIATPFLVRLSNGASTKADHREDYKACEEFLEKLTDQTPDLVVEKFYEALSRGDKAEAAEVRFMLTMRWPAKVLGLRRNGKNYAEFTNTDAGHAGYRYKGLNKYSAIRVLYTVGNLLAYLGLFALPALPIILGKRDIFDREWSAIVSYALVSIASFCMAVTRIKAMAGLSCACQLVAMNGEVQSPKPVKVKALALVPDKPEDQDVA